MIDTCAEIYPEPMAECGKENHQRIGLVKFNMITGECFDQNDNYIGKASLIDGNKLMIIHEFPEFPQP